MRWQDFIPPHALPSSDPRNQGFADTSAGQVFLIISLANISIGATSSYLHMQSVLCSMDCGSSDFTPLSERGGYFLLVSNVETAPNVAFSRDTYLRPNHSLHT